MGRTTSSSLSAGRVRARSSSSPRASGALSRSMRAIREAVTSCWRGHVRCGELVNGTTLPSCGRGTYGRSASTACSGAVAPVWHSPRRWQATSCSGSSTPQACARQTRSSTSCASATFHVSATATRSLRIGSSPPTAATAASRCSTSLASSCRSTVRPAAAPGSSSTRGGWLWMRTVGSLSPTLETTGSSSSPSTDLILRSFVSSEPTSTRRTRSPRSVPTTSLWLTPATARSRCSMTWGTSSGVTTGRTTVAILGRSTSRLAWPWITTTALLSPTRRTSGWRRSSAPWTRSRAVPLPSRARAHPGRSTSAPAPRAADARTWPASTGTSATARPTPARRTQPMPYPGPGPYPWHLRVTFGGETCEQSGTVTVCALTCSASASPPGLWLPLDVTFTSRRYGRGQLPSVDRVRLGLRRRLTASTAAEPQPHVRQ